ncbi:hypothetical protein Taro_017608 [Colocasia esculenta]|uniref:Uncharacterized protein n=1 Tax=Colocasia esculenta TaxID=4460 RepID=A0A843UTS6_COLES|nr:hypothetical protein [Colocasia esculenta]
MSRRSNRPQHHEALYFPHRRLWITEYSCEVWYKPCRRRLIPRQHSKHSWRPRKTKKFVIGLKPSLRTRLVAFDHRTLDEALSAISGGKEGFAEEAGSDIPAAG